MPLRPVAGNLRPARQRGRNSEGEHAVIVARIVKSVMVATVGLFGCMVAYNNCVDYDSNRAFVQHVLAMDTVFPFNAVKGRAITSPAVFSRTLSKTTTVS